MMKVPIIATIASLQIHPSIWKAEKIFPTLKHAANPETRAPKILNDPL